MSVCPTTRGNTQARYFADVKTGTLMLHACIQKHFQRFAISKKRFVALLIVWAVDIHQPTCQFAKEQHLNVEAYRLEKML